MQYQVFKRDTGELIAWIDTNGLMQVMKEGYGIKYGENLTVREEGKNDEAEK